MRAAAGHAGGAPALTARGQRPKRAGGAPALTARGQQRDTQAARPPPQHAGSGRTRGRRARPHSTWAAAGHAGSALNVRAARPPSQHAGGVGSGHYAPAGFWGSERGHAVQADDVCQGRCVSCYNDSATAGEARLTGRNPYLALWIQMSRSTYTNARSFGQ